MLRLLYGCFLNEGMFFFVLHFICLVLISVFVFVLDIYCFHVMWFVKGSVDHQIVNN